MSLVQTVGDHLKEAMKAGDVDRREALRMLQSALKNEAIEKRKPLSEMSDAEAELVVRRLVKQRCDSTTQYRAGGREDLATKEEKECVLLSTYLPPEMPHEEIERFVKEAISESGASSPKDMGKVMGLTLKKINGRASGDAVRAVVESKLGSLS